MDKVCGLDVHKDSVFACILGTNEKKLYEGRFGTTTFELQEVMLYYANRRRIKTYAPITFYTEVMMW